MPFAPTTAAAALHGEVVCFAAVITAADPLLFGGDGQNPNPLNSFDYEPRRSAQPRALVVDDAPDVTEMLAMLLQYAGYEVVSVYSGPQALDAARGAHFDVLISDIGMPGMNGYELAEALRQLPDYQSIPMIAVTGFTMYDDRDRALESGFNAFLSKPINPLDLINLVARLRG